MMKSTIIINYVLVLLLITLLLLPQDVISQDFTEAVECPNDSSITGYTTITSLNLDMRNEYNRIIELPTENDSDRNLQYELFLCPGTTFDVLDEGAIYPTLNNLIVKCPTGPESDEPCIIRGSQPQETQIIMIDEPRINSTINTGQEYIQTSVVFDGITFESPQTLSITAQASQPAKLTIQNSIWQDFESTNFLIAVFGGTDVTQPQTLEIKDSIIKDGSADWGFINVGGQIIVDNVQILDIDSITNLFDAQSTENSNGLIDISSLDVQSSEFGVMFTSNPGSTINVKSSTVTGSETQTISITRDSTFNYDEFEFTENDFVGNGIVTEGASAKTTANSVTIEENKNNSDEDEPDGVLWTVFATRDGGMLELNDLVFRENENAFAISISEDANTRVVANNVEILENTNPIDDNQQFLGFYSRRGGSHEISGLTFNNNMGVSYATRIERDDPDSTLTVEDSTFIGNQADQNAGSTALFRTLDGNAVLRNIQVDSNTGFFATIVVTDDGTMDFRDMCWLGNNVNNALAVFQMGATNSSFTAENNFVSTSEETILCDASEPNLRVVVDEDCVEGIATQDTCSDITEAPMQSPGGGSDEINRMDIRRKRSKKFGNGKGKGKGGAKSFKSIKSSKKLFKRSKGSRGFISKTRPGKDHFVPVKGFKVSNLFEDGAQSSNQESPFLASSSSASSSSSSEKEYVGGGFKISS